MFISVLSGDPAKLVKAFALFQKNLLIGSDQRGIAGNLDDHVVGQTAGHLSFLLGVDLFHKAFHDPSL